MSNAEKTQSLLNRLNQIDFNKLSPKFFAGGLVTVVLGGFVTNTLIDNKTSPFEIDSNTSNRAEKSIMGCFTNAKNDLVGDDGSYDHIEFTGTMNDITFSVDVRNDSLFVPAYQDDDVSRRMSANGRIQDGTVTLTEIYYSDYSKIDYGVETSSQLATPVYHENNNSVTATFHSLGHNREITEVKASLEIYGEHDGWLGRHADVPKQEIVRYATKLSECTQVVAQRFTR